MLETNRNGTSMRKIGFAAVIVSFAAATQAYAQSPALCEYVIKVLNTKANDFAPLKGQARNPAVFHNEVFDGALKAVPNGECTLDIRHKAGRTEIPPRYTCSLGKATNFADANRIFARAAQDLRACFPRAKFESMNDGDGKDPGDAFDWIISAEQTGYDLQLEMSNGVGLIAQGMTGATGPAEIDVTLDITNTAEARSEEQHV